MEKLRISIYTLALIVIALVAFALSKSWIMFDRGIEIVEEPSKNTVTEQEPAEPEGDLVTNSRVIWEEYLYHPIDLNRETGGYYTRKSYNHAKNLVFYNLKKGKIRRLFEKNVYIWDFFSGGEFLDEGEIEEKYEFTEGLEIGKKLVIIAMVDDTNGDGFLNQKDRKKVFLYDPQLDRLNSILPKAYYMEKWMPGAGKGLLVFLVKRFQKEKTEDTESDNTKVFVYDSQEKKGKLISEEFKRPSSESIGK